MTFAPRLARWRRSEKCKGAKAMRGDVEATRQGALVYLDRAERELARERRAHDETRRALAQVQAQAVMDRRRIAALEAQVRTLQARRPAP